MPDVALFAGAGMLQTAFVMCIASSAHPCDYANSTDAMAQAVGGTSVSSPAMAGIMAMVNQKMGTPQGSANASLYALAARDNRANCNTVTVGTGNACNFYDITTGGNAVPCVAGSLNCVVTHQGDQLGILSGYQAGVGYDLATGLGSVNAANLVNNWHLAGSAVSQVTVPNAVGSTQIAATTALNLADLGLGTVARQNSTSVASGSVISQNPVAGALVASGTNVALVVSSGAPIVLPNEVGLTQAAATASLKGIGALLGTISNTPNGCYTTGTVTSQSPAAGTVISGGASVSLVIAAAAPRVAVPNMSGVPTAFASTILANRGLNTGAITQVSSTAYDSGIVVGESPAAGTSVAACSSVSLLVSSGPPTVTVPSTVGLTQTAATNVLFSVGFGIVVTQQASATVAAGKVLSETPAAGSKIAPGSPVHLVISSGPSLIKVPNAVGLTQAAASTLLTSKSLVLGAVTLQTSTSVAAGFVISELPAAGTASAAGSKVALIVSRGRT
jgi:beta-lactam-binding protein with PASTA domain